MLTASTMLEHNCFKRQDYFQNDKYNYFAQWYDSATTQLNFIYLPQKNDKIAALNFHITSNEKKDVLLSFNDADNNAAIKKLTDKLEQQLICGVENREFVSFKNLMQQFVQKEK